MRHLVFGVLFASAASVANAATLTAMGVPASDGILTTVTFLLNLEPGDALRGFDAEFSGAVHQSNPFGSVATIFTDNNGVFEFDPERDVSLDSQFLFNSGEIVSIGVMEADGLLKGAVSGLAPLNLSGSVPIAQIAADGWVRVDIQFDINGQEQTFGGVIGFPEPSSAVIAGVGLLAGAARRRRA